MMTRDDILALPNATLDDVRAREAAIMAECCEGAIACTCPMPPLLSKLSIPRRLPIVEQVVINEDTGATATCEKMCDCGEPSYEVILHGRRAVFCRGAINRMKMDSLKPAHPQNAPESICYAIEIYWGDDGFVGGVKRSNRSVTVTQRLIAEGKIKVTPEGHILDVPELIEET